MTPQAILLLIPLGAVLTVAALYAAKPFLPRSPNYARRLTPVSAGISYICIILVTIAVGFGVVGFGGGVMAMYLLVAVVVGAIDDVWGDGGIRGLRGHIRELESGRFTTGMSKLVSLGAGALVVGLVLYGLRWEALYGAFLLAGFANLGNLFDVRPGRTVKFMGVVSLPMLLAAPYGVSGMLAGLGAGIVALFYFDLKGRIMLGDAGAGVVGCVPGLLAISCGPGAVWWLAGAFVLVLTAVAEFSSISRLIEEVGVLRWLDLLGRAGRR